MHDNSATNASSDSDHANTLTSQFSSAVQPSSHSNGGHKQNGHRILVVEDDATLATLEADILTAHGYLVVSVQSGELAITFLHQSIPDLVVLDLELTGAIHGWDVLQTLRSTTPIPVLITSSSATSARHYLRKSGETRLTLDHLPKPYPLQALLKRIKRMLPISPSH